jgi:hypothetical protein
MISRKVLLPILLAYALFSMSCAYIVLPAGLEAQEASGKGSGGWSALPTSISASEDGDLRIELALRNDTGDWSAMSAMAGEPAVLESGGQTVDCETVFVGTGGHRFAPGFQLSAFTAGTKAEPEIQPVYVECAGAEAAPGAVLTIPYSYVTGQYNYYEQDKNLVESRLEISLDAAADEVAGEASGLEYPVAEPMDGLVQSPDVEITALNKVVLKLVDVQRTDQGFQFTWSAFNPGEYPTYVHIGTPPVIGADGVLYGYYETPDIVTVPIIPAGGEAEWTTEVAVPAEVGNFYILLSVETGKARLFANYAVDISGE